MPTLSAHDKAFYEARAEAELELAQRSTDPCAVKIHFDLANRYLSLLYEDPNERPAFAALNNAVRCEARAKVGKAEILR